MVRVVGMGSVPRAIPECLNKVSLSSWVIIWSPRVWWLHKSRLSKIRPFLTAEEHLGGERWPGEEIARGNTMETGSKCTGEKPCIWGGMGSNLWSLLPIPRRKEKSGCLCSLGVALPLIIWPFLQRQLERATEVSPRGTNKGILRGR